MKVCIPVEADRGLESIPYGHFGSASLFMLCDTESNETKVIDNQNLHHAHGTCNPLKAIEGETVDAVIVGGIGARAIAMFNSKGIKVFRADEGTIGDNITLLKDNRLSEMSPACGCTLHGCGH